MWLLSWRVMRDMCASCRVLHDPVVFDTCYWWMRFRQPWVDAHVQESKCEAHWRSGSYEILSRFYYVRVDSRSIQVTRTILQSMSWWIFLCWNSVLYVASTYLDLWAIISFFGDMIRWWQTVVAYSSDWLSASRAILAGICFPPILSPVLASVDTWTIHKNKII